jgi:peroxiredoxin
MKTGSKLALVGLASLALVVAGLGVLAGCAGVNTARAGLAFLGNGGSRVASRNTQNTLGVPAPGFTGVDVVTGQSVALQQFKGKTVLLNLVNYGCSPDINRAVSEQLIAIRELSRHRDDFVPVSVFCGCCPPETLRQFARSNDLNWPWLLDTDNSMVAKYSGFRDQFGYPTLIFIDKDQLITDASGALTPAELGAMLDKAADSGSSVSSQVQ